MGSVIILAKEKRSCNREKSNGYRLNGPRDPGGEGNLRGFVLVRESASLGKKKGTVSLNRGRKDHASAPAGKLCLSRKKLESKLTSSEKRREVESWGNLEG